MSNFEKAVTVVLQHEGGYVNDPVDPGGETKYGITKRTYPNVDIKNLTMSQAKAIYLRDFWNPYAYDLIDNDDAATKIFDTSVNMGAKRAFRFAQMSLNAQGFKLVVDGVFGTKSVAAMNKSDPEAFVIEFRKQQVKYYQGLVDAKPKLGKYLRGWLARAEH